VWLHGSELGLHGSHLNHGPTGYLLHGGGHGIHGRRLKSGGRGRGREAGLGHFRRWGCLRGLNRIHDPVNDEQKKLKRVTWSGGEVEGNEEWDMSASHRCCSETGRHITRPVGPS